MAERNGMTLNGYTREVEVPDGFTAQVVDAFAVLGNYTATIKNPVPRPPEGEEGDWEPRIPNPQNKVDFCMSQVRDYMFQQVEQAGQRVINEASRKAQADAREAAALAKKSIVTIEV